MPFRALSCSQGYRWKCNDDIPLLAEMNKRLIEDEGSRNPMTVGQLADRMAGWLRGAWKADLILQGSSVVGYAVYPLRHDEYFPEEVFVYLRQFYVERDRRDRGIGAAALELLIRDSFSRGARVVIDVLACNPRGRRFWPKVGFEPYCTTMWRVPDGRE